MVNDKQAYYEHLNESFRQFEEPFFDKLVQKNLSLFTLLNYVLDYNSRENEKELSQDGKILLKQKARTKHIDEICLANSPAFNKCLATFFGNQLQLLS